jgi:hypothetical protein
LHIAAGVTVRILAVLLLIPCLAAAQDTRAGEIEAAQREKAERLAPSKPHWAEDLLLTVRQTIVEEPAGLYPYFGSVYSGGGFTLGAGIRRYSGDRTHFGVAGLYSAKNYKLIEATVASPGHWSGRADFRAVAGWRDATQVAFHGLGIDSPADSTAAYRMQQGYGGGAVTVRPQKALLLTGEAAFEDYTIGDPSGDHIPVPNNSAVAPGVGTNPLYLHTTISAAVDWRPAADYARRGGLYQLSRHHYDDRDGAFSFDRLDAEIVQHVPILRENWVVSVRGRLQTTLGDEDQVPYFMMPSLGSGSTLRGYSSWRFRDRHSALLNAEWRWIASRMAIDMAVFFDTGTVAPTFDAIALRSFVNNYGIGVRFHGPARTPLRVELARGTEGMHLVFAASAAF